MNKEKIMTHEELEQIVGGGFDIKIDIPWDGFRDTLRGFGDGFFRHKNKY